MNQPVDQTNKRCEPTKAARRESSLGHHAI
jgi:hypothetical protein